MKKQFVFLMMSGLVGCGVESNVEQNEEALAAQASLADQATIEKISLGEDFTFAASVLPVFGTNKLVVSEPEGLVMLVDAVVSQGDAHRAWSRVRRD